MQMKRQYKVIWKFFFFPMRSSPITEIKLMRVWGYFQKISHSWNRCVIINSIVSVLTQRLIGKTDNNISSSSHLLLLSNFIPILQKGEFEDKQFMISYVSQRLLSDAKCHGIQTIRFFSEINSGKGNFIGFLSYIGFPYIM